MRVFLVSELGRDPAIVLGNRTDLGQKNAHQQFGRRRNRSCVLRTEADSTAAARLLS